MTSFAVQASPARAGRGPAPPWSRWWLLSLLLVAELSALSLRFSMGDMPDVADGRVQFVRNAKRTFHFCLGVGVPALVLGGPIVLAGWRRLGFRAYSWRTTGRIVLGHLAAFGAFSWLTWRVVEGGALLSGSGPATLWFAAWASTGLAMLATWAVAIVPLEVGKALAGRFLAALAIGGVVFGLVLVAASMTQEFWWNPLRYPTLWSVKVMLSAICPEVIYRPEVFTIGTPEFTVEVMPMCSGYEGIGLIWVFSAAYLVLNRRSLRFPRALWLIPLGTLAIWLANSLRLVVMILLGAWYSPKLAEETFHSLAGWGALNAVAIGMMLLAQRLRYFHDADGAAGDAAAPSAAIANPTPAYLAPLLALIASAMIAGAFPNGGFDRYYPACVAATLVALWPFRRRYAAMGPWSGSWLAVGVGALTFVGWMALEPLHRSPGAVDSATPAALASLGRPWALAWLAIRVFGSVVTVPLAEELAFRGFLTRRMIAADFESVPPGRFTWPSFVGSSVAFGLLHQRWLAGILAGMAFALVYYRRGRVGDAVIAHATANALIAIWVLATGDWSTWS